jgi:hypothetical protein
MSVPREAPPWPRRMLTGIRTAGRRMAAPSNRGLIVVSVLCGLTVVFFVLGIAVQPSGSTPATTPNTPGLNLTFQSNGPQQLNIYVSLVQANGSPTELVVEAAGVFAPNQGNTRWTMGILGFSGYLCPGQASVPSLIPLGHTAQDYEIIADSSIPGTSGSPFFLFHLCWNNGAPLIADGSYVSAALPAVTTGLDQSGTVTRDLTLSGTSLSSYSLVGGIAPTDVSGTSWMWTDDLSDAFQSQASSEIPIIASSLPGIQRDNSDIFYSGIFFGIAGGAAVSVIPAVLDAFDRRRQEAGRRTAADQAQRDAPSQSGVSEEKHEVQLWADTDSARSWALSC